MKKIYKNPTLNIVEIKTSQMIAASPEEVPVATGPAQEWGGARQHNTSIWDDEELDDEEF